MVADTYSTDGIGVLLQGTGNNNNAWGDNANLSVFQIIMDAIANVLTSAVTGGTLTLSGSPPPTASSQTRYAALKFTGILSSNQLVEVPNLNKWWIVCNATSGAFTLKFKTSGGSASTAIPQNSGWQIVRCDGANAIEVWPFNTKQVQMPDGTVALPAYSNLTEPSSGWWRAGTQDWRLSINGVDILQCTGTGASSASIVNVLSPNSLQVAGVAVFANGSTIKSADGTVGAPGVSFNSEATTGLYRVGAGDVGYSILGVRVLTINNTGFGITGVLVMNGNLTINTNKFTVDASNGNTVVAGTLAVTGDASAASMSGSAIASQAEQETGSATNKVVTPGRQHSHPSAAKFWLKSVMSAGVPQAPSASYNVTSVSDPGTSRIGVTIGTDFSSAEWCCLCSPETSTASGKWGILRAGTQAAGFFEVQGLISSTSGGDPDSWYIAGFGDQ